MMSPSMSLIRVTGGRAAARRVGCAFSSSSSSLMTIKNSSKNNAFHIAAIRRTIFASRRRLNLNLTPAAVSSYCCRASLALGAVPLIAIAPSVSRTESLVDAEPKAENVAGEMSKSVSARLSRLSRSLQRLLKLCWSLFNDCVRAIQLLIIFTPAAVTWPVLSAQHWNRLLVSSLAFAGPTFIKLGQWASTRPDLFSPQFCRDLSSLHESADSYFWPFFLKRGMIERAIDAPMDDVFVSFERESCGSGCIATVHRASIIPYGSDGKEVPVAVKLIRRGVRDTIFRDLNLMRRAISALRFLCRVVPSGESAFRFLSVREACEQFEKFMMGQLDLREEAANLDKFRANFHNDPHVRFPEPLRRARRVGDGSPCCLSHPDLLVETFAEGVSLSSFLTAASEKLKCGAETLDDAAARKTLARHGVRAFLKMALVHNFVHSDLHPGNIIVGFDERGRAALTFIDAGLVTCLEEKDRKNFIDLFTAVAKKDGRAAARHMIERSVGSECTDPDGYTREIEAIVKEVAVTSFQLQDVQIGRVLRRVLDASRDYKVKLDANFTSLILSIIILEGVGRQLNPDLDIFRAAMPILMGMK